MTYNIRNLGSGLGQAQQYGVVKPNNVITTLTIFNIFGGIQIRLKRGQFFKTFIKLGTCAPVV
jgi:hypothetical protein